MLKYFENFSSKGKKTNNYEKIYINSVVCYVPLCVVKYPDPNYIFIMENSNNTTKGYRNMFTWEIFPSLPSIPDIKPPSNVYLVHSTEYILIEHPFEHHPTLNKIKCIYAPSQYVTRLEDHLSQCYAIIANLDKSTFKYINLATYELTEKLPCIVKMNREINEYFKKFPISEFNNQKEALAQFTDKGLHKLLKIIYGSDIQIFTKEFLISTWSITAPFMLPLVEKALVDYKGREKELIQHIKTNFGDIPTIKQRLCRIYRKYLPTHMGELQEMIASDVNIGQDLLLSLIEQFPGIENSNSVDSLENSILVIDENVRVMMGQSLIRYKQSKECEDLAHASDQILYEPIQNIEYKKTGKYNNFLENSIREGNKKRNIFTVNIKNMTLSDLKAKVLSISDSSSLQYNDQLDNKTLNGKEYVIPALYIDDISATESGVNIPCLSKPFTEEYQALTPIKKISSLVNAFNNNTRLMQLLVDNHDNWKVKCKYINHIYAQGGIFNTAINEKKILVYKTYYYIHKKFQDSITKMRKAILNKRNNFRYEILKRKYYEEVGKNFHIAYNQSQTTQDSGITSDNSNVITASIKEIAVGLQKYPDIYKQGDNKELFAKVKELYRNLFNLKDKVRNKQNENRELHMKIEKINSALFEMNREKELFQVIINENKAVLNASEYSGSSFSLESEDDIISNKYTSSTRNISNSMNRSNSLNSNNELLADCENYDSESTPSFNTKSDSTISIQSMSKYIKNKEISNIDKQYTRLVHRCKYIMKKYNPFKKQQEVYMTNKCKEYENYCQHLSDKIEKYKSDIAYIKNNGSKCRYCQPFSIVHDKNKKLIESMTAHISHLESYLSTSSVLNTKKEKGNFKQITERNFLFSIYPEIVLKDLEQKIETKSNSIKSNQKRIKQLNGLKRHYDSIRSNHST